MFCSPLNAEHSLSPIRSSYGVSTLLRFGIELAQVSTHTLQYIRSLERDADEASYEALTPFQPGASVIVREGSLVGLGAIVQMSDPQRVEVLLHLLGKDHRLVFSPGEIELV